MYIIACLIVCAVSLKSIRHRRQVEVGELSTGKIQQFLKDPVNDLSLEVQEQGSVFSEQAKLELIFESPKTAARSWDELIKSERASREAEEAAVERLRRREDKGGGKNDNDDEDDDDEKDESSSVYSDSSATEDIVYSYTDDISGHSLSATDTETETEIFEESETETESEMSEFGFFPE